MLLDFLLINNITLVVYFASPQTTYISQLTTTSYQTTTKHPKVRHPRSLANAYQFILGNVRPGSSRSSLCNLRTYQW